MIQEVNFISVLEGECSRKVLTLKNVKNVPHIGERVSITSFTNTDSRNEDGEVIKGQVIDVEYSYLHFGDNTYYDFEGSGTNQVLQHIDVYLKQPAQE